MPEKWYPTTVPSTVLGTLVKNKVYPDPYYGTNFKKLPGYFARHSSEIPDDSPYRHAWWYRTVFTLPEGLGSTEERVEIATMDSSRDRVENSKPAPEELRAVGAMRP